MTKRTVIPHSPGGNTESLNQQEAKAGRLPALNKRAYHIGTNMVPRYADMATTITLKNIPDEIYASLKQAAEVHHRSINSEVIACLERVLMPARPSAEEHLARARQIRDTLGAQAFSAADIAAAIEQGRP